MRHVRSKTPYLLRPFPVFFLVGLLIVNVVAIFNLNPFYIGSFLAFLYVMVIPGFLLLSFFAEKKFQPVLGVALSVALSMFVLMLVGLGMNTFLPMLGMNAPLSTMPLIIAFDAIVYLLLILNFEFGKSSPFEFHEFNWQSWLVLLVSASLPVLACLGATILSNGGSNMLVMIALALVPPLVLTVVLSGRLSPSVPPIVLYMMAASFLLMNSMRGWFITGHDILLEYHVFTLTNDAHRWAMAFYQDPYNACLSLTILPTYLQSLLHSSPAYIYKFFFQFVGALPVVAVYYLAKQYASEKIAFLAAFLYVTFPTFMVDMAFLNRQSIAFLFFGCMLLVMFDREYFTGRTKTALLFVLGTGMVFSHYSTSYIAVPVLLVAYALNRIVRWVIMFKRPKWFFNLTERLGNKEMYSQPILLTLPFVIGLMAVMVLWSTVITKTSKSFVNTVQQIVVSLKHPFSLDEQTGPAKYSIVRSAQPSPEELLSRFVKEGIQKHDVVEKQSEFYPLALTESYPAKPVLELPAPLTVFGQKLQIASHVNLNNFFNDTKQLYAKILQVLLMVGLAGLALGYTFKKNVLRNVPIEYIAISISGIVVMIGQTILPANAIDYGLLRLFQQNLIFLTLPIFLGLFLLVSFVFRSHKGRLVACALILVAFSSILSGLVPQITGGARPLLSLNNSGLYYDSYYTHAQEVASAEWIAQYGGAKLPVQAAHFSDIKMIAYGRLAPYIELLPETTKKNSFVYLNYDNVKTSNILEIIYGDVVYYHFPMEFLQQNKSLIYSNGGSAIYR